ncbi:phiSA1p31-related protein [Kitasatospora purpeofusca]|uniref:phiSA1p31-related protein n=1 Tax=Kitasatospora purpeofusca TaxID=67352 RepID=UPI0035E0B43C
MPEQTFKIGETVTHEEMGPVVIRSAPFAWIYGRESRYVVEVTEGSRAGKHVAIIASRLSAAAFEHGAAVLVAGERCTVAGGPFVDKFAPARPWYVVENADGSHETSAAHLLTLASVDEPIEVGDRVRVLEAKYAESEHGKLGRVVRTDGTWTPRDGGLHPYQVELDEGSTIEVRRVERVADEPASTFTHDGVTYDLTASYRDRDNDLWSFTGSTNAYGRPLVSMFADRSGGRSIGSVVEAYGPLTKVTD